MSSVRGQFYNLKKHSCGWMDDSVVKSTQYKTVRARVQIPCNKHPFNKPSFSCVPITPVPRVSET